MQQFFTPKLRRYLKLFQNLLLSLYLVYFFNNTAIASNVVQAEIYKIYNQVDINYRQQSNWNQAELGDKVAPRDSVRTGANSRADLLFNEGTLVRTGAGTTFRFPSGKRNFELTSGAALIMIRPELGDSIITTPQAKVVSKGTALFLQHDPQTDASLIGVLTDSPAGLVEVSSNDGQVNIKLQAGQFVSIVHGIVGFVEHFVLPIFYETVELSAGLGLNPQAMEMAIANEAPEVQATIRAVQAEAIEPLKNQQAWLNGFCQLSVETKNLSSLLQLFGLGVSDTKVTLEIPENDLLVIPFRSPSGVAWLKEYCQAETTLPGFEPADKQTDN